MKQATLIKGLASWCLSNIINLVRTSECLRWLRSVTFTCVKQVIISETGPSVRHRETVTLDLTERSLTKQSNKQTTRSAIKPANSYQQANSTALVFNMQSECNSSFMQPTRAGLRRWPRSPNAARQASSQLITLRWKPTTTAVNQYSPQ